MTEETLRQIYQLLNGPGFFCEYLTPDAKKYIRRKIIALDITTAGGDPNLLMMNPPTSEEDDEWGIK